MSEGINKDALRYDEELLKLKEFERRQKEVFLELQKVGEAACESAKDSAKEAVVVMSSGLSSGFSKIYGLKVKKAAMAAFWHNLFFVLVVIGALVFSWFNGCAIREVSGCVHVVLSKAGTVLIPAFPMYAFLIWLAYVARKNSIVNRRIRDIYAHKQLFGAAVAGLLRQIKSVDRLNEQKGAELMTHMTSALIGTLEKDCSLSIDVKNPELPIGEATDGVANVIDALSKLTPWKQNTQT